MKPEARVWRKGQKAASKNTRSGRRSTHMVKVQAPSKYSSWTDRYRWADWKWQYYSAFAGTGRLVPAAKAAAAKSGATS